MKSYICPECKTIVKMRDGWFLPEQVKVIRGVLWCASCMPYLKQDFGSDCHPTYFPSTGRMQPVKEIERDSTSEVP